MASGTNVLMTMSAGKVDRDKLYPVINVVIVITNLLLHGTAGVSAGSLVWRLLATARVISYLHKFRILSLWVFF